MRIKRGFTLVELLVVISIIALLLSILIPSLNRAREAAKSVVCKTNLKTIGMAEILFAEENDGKVAWYRYDDYSSGYRVYYWAAQLWSSYNKLDIPQYYDLSVPPIKSPKWLNCPSERYDTWYRVWHDVPRTGGSTDNFWLQNISYSRNAFNNRIGMTSGSNVVYPQVKLTQIDSPSRMVDVVDGGYISINDAPVYTDMYLTGNIFNPHILEGGRYRQALYRHQGKKGLNVLLWDGHVESVKNSISDKFLRLPQICGR